MIIGPGSIGIAAEMALLKPTHEFIGLADAPLSIDHAMPGGSIDYRPVSISHSFDFDYKPSHAETEWLRAHAAIKQQAEVWDQLIAHEPVAKSTWYCFDNSMLYPKMPRHRSEFTKSQPSRKARKAGRHRARVGRKASR